MHAIYDPLFDHHSSSTEFPDITKSVIDDMISEGKMNLDLSKVQSYVALTFPRRELLCLKDLCPLRLILCAFRKIILSITCE